MSDYLPINIDAQNVKIDEAGGGWEVIIVTEEYGELYVWMEMCDPLYDQLHDAGILTVEDGEVVANE